MVGVWGVGLEISAFAAEKMEVYDAYGNPLRYPWNHDNEGDDNRLEGDISEPEVIMPDDNEQQKKRKTQEKVKSEHLMNLQLGEDNNRLRKENQLMNSKPVYPTCNDRGSLAFSSCSVEELSNKGHQMKAEDAKLKDAIDHLVAVAKSWGKPIPSCDFLSSSRISSSEVDLPGKRKSADIPSFVDKTLRVGPFPGDRTTVTSYAPSLGPPARLCNTANYPKKVDIFEAAISAMDALIKLSETPGGPLWTRTISREKKALNYEDYLKVFNGVGMIRIGTIDEASRHTAVVPINSLAVVETLVDVNKWIEAFPCIVTNASIVEKVSSSLGTRNGTLQLMDAELLVLSPLVSVRQVRFLRFYQQHEGVWPVVDVLLKIGGMQVQLSSAKGFLLAAFCRICRMVAARLPGLNIWNMTGLVFTLFHDVLTYDVVFGAKRWMALLERHCEYWASVMQPSSHGMNNLGKRNIIKLAQRMPELFYSGICSSSRRKWETLSSGISCVRLMLCKNIDGPLKPVGMLLSTTATIWLPVKQLTLFNFLYNHCNRNEWDTLSNGRPMQEIPSITKAPGHKNRASVLCANGVDSSQASMVLSQEAWIDASGSLIVYAPVDVLAINA